VGVELSRRLGTANARALEVKGLNAIVSRLSALHYEARWEAGAEGPRFLFGHCPYAAIIQRHPELCEVDGELLEAVTGHSMYQHAKIGEQGSLVCMFSRAAPADAEPLRGFNV
jgi:predicted ArsR family transcriptional regulator